MSDTNDQPGGTGPISGNMLLYENPQLLTSEDHGHLGLKGLERPFGFAGRVRAIPVVAGEFVSVQKHCPIVFHGDDPMPFALLGLKENDNLFVDHAGRWTTPGYMPAYLRCYPLALATAADDRFAVVFDRDAPMVSDEPDVPFFEGQALSKGIQERVELCRSYEAEKERTRRLMETLKRLNLLTVQEASQTLDGGDEALVRYRAVHRQKLSELGDEDVCSLFRDGSLGFIMAHLFSLETFSELMRRRAERNAAPDAQRPPPEIS